MASNHFNTIHNPDVLSCLANLSSDEVFTPPDVANAMLDLLPQELFSDPNAKFLDPGCKSGVFLREIAKRLLKGLEPLYPDLQERANHIFKEQLYGIAITELTAHLTRRSLYCSKSANGSYSVADFDSIDGNVRFKITKHRWQNGKCEYCGASQQEYDRPDDLETHAYEWIHTDKPDRIFKMKFDVIIGNPPYHLNDGGSGTGISAKPIYQFFVEQAKKLNPRYLTMIIPSRWFAGGKGLDEFRVSMLHDRHMRVIYDYMSSKDCFPGVNIAGGVNYFLWDKGYNGPCTIYNCTANSGAVEGVRYLDEFNVFIRDNRALSIIHKFLNSKDECLANHTYTRNPFGFMSKERGNDKPYPNCENVKLISSGGTGYVKRSSVTKNIEEIDNYKVTIGKIVPSNGEVDTDPADGYKVTTFNKIIGPGEIHTESYLLLHGFKKLNEAKNFSEYMALKFPRFMMKHTLSSMNISTHNFVFVPFLDYTRRWSDAQLYERYGLTRDEADYVESLIRPMDYEGGDD
ncbi:MAG: Eco57I restriction-modification methylase domain-containing protein [Thermoguttaceae bacterium]|nr:Eco57I restriction-modification methylase domain-containing protein [Thermoguttaceae bacterium]